MNVNDIQKAIVRDETNLMKPFKIIGSKVTIDTGDTVKDAILKNVNMGEITKQLAINMTVKYFSSGDINAINQSVDFAMNNGTVAYAMLIHSLATSMCVYYKWSLTKIVYSISKDMADMLINTADSEMHIDVLKYLPINTFYLIWHITLK